MSTDKPVEHSVHKAVDSIQQRLTSYACDLNYGGLSPEAFAATMKSEIARIGKVIKDAGIRAD